MIICNEFVLLNIPKSGSTFARTVIKEIHKKRICSNFINKIGFELNLIKKGYEEHFASGLFTERKNQHGGYSKIPPQHKDKEIVSIIRNPYDQVVSAYRFGWWKEHYSIDMPLLNERFPSFSNLSFEEFLKFKNLIYKTLGRKVINNDIEIGYLTARFIQMFFRNPINVLKNCNEHYFNDKFLYGEDMAKVTFLRSESLNEDLSNFLYEKGYEKEEALFVLNHKKENVTFSELKKDFWTKDSIQYFEYKERFLFKILTDYGFHYSKPNVS